MNTQENVYEYYSVASYERDALGNILSMNNGGTPPLFAKHLKREGCGALRVVEEFYLTLPTINSRKKYVVGEIIHDREWLVDQYNPNR